MNKHFQVFLSLVIGILLVCILIACYSNAPFKALKVFFTINISSLWHFGNMLDKMGLLLFASVGICFAFKCGLFNLGGEGQIYLAAYLTSVLLEHASNIVSPLYLFFVLILVSFTLLIIGVVLGLLKAFYNIDELISSFLVSSALVPTLNYLIISRMKGSELLATSRIDSSFVMKSILYPSTFNISFFIALVFCVLVYMFFKKTKIGYHFAVSGFAKDFAIFAGFNQKASIIVGLAFSSFAHALTGFFAIVGTYQICHLNFSHGLGWAAIVISLIARQNILLLIPSSFLYAWLQNASEATVSTGNVSFDVSIFFQGAIFLFISASIIKNKMSITPRNLKKHDALSTKK
ncbi:MAG: ABC transporter permease [Treponema sp.]